MPALKLSQVSVKQDAPTLSEVARATVDGRVIVLATRTDGQYVLAREVERASKDADGNTVVGADGKPVREHVLKSTPLVADFADAIAGGLLAV